MRLSSGETCKSPCTLEKKRKHNFTVFIEKPGYEPTNVSVVSQVAGAGAAGMAGNVIFGGIIGAGVDAGTGATKELIPNPVVVKLEPLEQFEDKREVSRRSNNIQASRKRSDVIASRKSSTNKAKPKSPKSSDEQTEERILAELDHKVHENIQGNHYIWLDLSWTSTFDEEIIWQTSGKLKIAQTGTDRTVSVPWSLERELAPGETIAEEESGFEIKKTSEAAWLLHAEKDQLEIEYVPEKVVFADGSEKIY